MGQADRKMVAAYLEKRMEGGDEYTRRHYGSLIDKILNFKGMIVEDLSLEKALQKAKEEGKYVFMDCYTTWCGPCKMLSPVVEEIAGESDAYRVCKINVDDAPEIAARYRVMSIPTLIVFQGGEAAARTVGVQSKQTILNMLK